MRISETIRYWYILTPHLKHNRLMMYNKWKWKYCWGK